MTTEMKPTAGPWEYVKSTYKDNSAHHFVGYNRHGDTVLTVCKLVQPLANASIEANARIIAEAGTVCHETGLTPRQLAEQRQELLEALEAFCEEEPRVASEIDGDVSCPYCGAYLQVDEPHSGDCPWIRGKAAILKARGENAEMAV
ncbi:hypothetical protein [Fimbriiglobus ruber]|uniref:hypothetical protein n=1 Tax=Fimbriiglobus ruber TaxID=1908690 RepID=UPI000B4A91F3|nr:hypothetical protein [Fimbriiglobus ruber]